MVARDEHQARGRTIARRRRRWAALAIGSLLFLALLVAFAVTVRGRVSHGHARWQLAGVSADARTLTFAREANLCGSQAQVPAVREDARTVRITLPTTSRQGLFSGGVDCAAVSGTTYVEVRLRRPLGRRALTQPSGGTPPGTAGLSARLAPGGEGCIRLLAIPATAPARDVPWVQVRIRDCGRGAGA